jgi:hypothetical protein
MSEAGRTRNVSEIRAMGDVAVAAAATRWWAGLEVGVL